MKLSSIKIRGMHKVTNKTYDLSGFRYFFGENGAGKSTIMQAVQLALLGYIPGTDKTKTEIFKHSDGRAMSVELTLDDDGRQIVISRTWERKGKDIVAKSGVSPAVYDTKGIVGNLELPVFNFNDFVGMTANKLKDWFMNFLPPADAEIDWDYELSNSIADFGKILDQEFFNSTVDYVKSLANENSGVQLVREFNAYLKEQLSAYKAAQTRMQSTIQNLIYYNDCDDSQSIEELTQTNKEAYDVIFVGFPVWWYTAPAVIRTFLEAYDFGGKVIVPFATSGGSGLGNTAKTLQELVPAAAVKDGKLLNGGLDAGELKKWADSFETDIV